MKLNGHDLLLPADAVAVLIVDPADERLPLQRAGRWVCVCGLPRRNSVCSVDLQPRPGEALHVAHIATFVDHVDEAGGKIYRRSTGLIMPLVPVVSPLNDTLQGSSHLWKKYDSSAEGFWLLLAGTRFLISCSLVMPLVFTAVGVRARRF